MKRRLDMRRRFYVLVFFRIRQAPLLLLLLACGRRSYPLLSDVPTRPERDPSLRFSLTLRKPSDGMEQQHGASASTFLNSFNPEPGSVDAEVLCAQVRCRPFQNAWPQLRVFRLITGLPICRVFSRS
jgi:hypothetical protein